MMLCRTALWLSGKVVALHLDNRTAKDYVIKVVKYPQFHL